MVCVVSVGNMFLILIFYYIGVTFLTMESAFSSSNVLILGMCS